MVSKYSLNHSDCRTASVSSASWRMYSSTFFSRSTAVTGLDCCKEMRVINDHPPKFFWFCKQYSNRLNFVEPIRHKTSKIPIVGLFLRIHRFLQLYSKFRYIVLVPQCQ